MAGVNGSSSSISREKLGIPVRIGHMVATGGETMLGRTRPAGGIGTDQKGTRTIMDHNHRSCCHHCLGSD